MDRKRVSVLAILIMLLASLSFTGPAAASVGQQFLLQASYQPEVDQVQLLSGISLTHTAAGGAKWKWSIAACKDNAGTTAILALQASKLWPMGFVGYISGNATALTEWNQGFDGAAQIAARGVFGNMSGNAAVRYLSPRLQTLTGASFGFPATARPGLEVEATGKYRPTKAKHAWTGTVRWHHRELNTFTAAAGVEFTPAGIRTGLAGGLQMNRKATTPLLTITLRHKQWDFAADLLFASQKLNGRARLELELGTNITAGAGYAAGPYVYVTTRF